MDNREVSSLEDWRVEHDRTIGSSKRRCQGQMLRFRGQINGKEVLPRTETQYLRGRESHSNAFFGGNVTTSRDETLALRHVGACLRCTIVLEKEL